MLAAASVIAVLGLVSNSLSPVHGKKIAKPDSKVARNVLEGKAEGYCSVSSLNDTSATQREADSSSRRDL